MYPNDPILFTNCDIRNGYYSVSIRNSKRDYTAFIVGHEQLRYRRLSQGLSLAPSTFSHFMSEVFSSLKKRGEDSGKFGLFSYLDDYILVSAQSFHVEAIEIILKKCEEANLVMALQKCSFANSVVEFVGFKVSSTGYTVKKSKVDALLNLKYPTSKKEAMQYLNSFTYFSCSIPRLSFLMRPLCDEIKNKKFELTDRVKLSLKKLKDSIRGGIGTTHLSYSNLGQQKIFLAVDSSMVAAGYALGNCIFNGQTPTEITFSHFGSTNFDNITMNMGSRCRELLGLSAALEDFSDLLPTSLELLVFVDHESLCSLFSKQSLGTTGFHSRVRKAYAVVMNWPKLKLYHLPGKSDLMSMVDGISRLSGPAKEVNSIHLHPDFSVSSNSLHLEVPMVT